MRTLKDFERMRKLLAVFHEGMLQGFFTLLGLLEKEGITLEDVKWYVGQLEEREKARRLQKARALKAGRKVTEEQKKWKEKGRSCPVCGTFLSLDKVVAPRGNANVYGYRGVWRCTGEECLFEEFTQEYPEAIYDKLMGR